MMLINFFCYNCLIFDTYILKKINVPTSEYKSKIFLYLEPNYTVL